MNPKKLVFRLGKRVRFLPAFLVFVTGLGAIAPGLNAQTIAGMWQPADAAVSAKGTASAWVKPDVARHYRLDRSAARTVLLTAPSEGFGLPAQITIPDPNGKPARFQIYETAVMSPGLAAEFPDIHTYAGQGIDDPAASIRVGWSSAGFYAQVLAPSGSYYVEPRFRDDSELHAVFYKRNYTRANDGFSCLVVSDDSRLPAALPRDFLRSGPTLRTYRMAVAATGEYVAFHGGTLSNGVNAIVQAINRVTGIYQVEMGIRLQLVPNNSLIVFTNAVTDPYQNGNVIQMLTVNQSVVDSIIGSANYDIGHVFGTDSGGIAGLGVVCVPGQKARGVTGSAAPIGDPFWVDYVSHEVGHQFGANHTFNGTGGACAGNRNDTTAYEPGSGATIMAYAGICFPDDLQPLSDPYFHSASFDEIIAFIGGIGGSCAVQSATGNDAPVVTPGLSYTIPIGTPFRLTAAATDPNGHAVTYCWEERDLGPALALAAADNGSSPLFRSFNPTNSPTRVFPNLPSLATGVPSLGEQLPTLARTMNFRVTARDNQANGGGVNTADVALQVDATAGPFAVTAPGSITNATNILTVQWNVANTTNATVNAQTVNIRMSADGGLTFPVLLAAGTPNDGTEDVLLPPINTTSARIMVEAGDNIFFALSPTNFTINSTNDADVTLSISAPAQAVIATNFTYSVIVSNAGPELAAGIFVTNTLPVNSTFVSASNTTGILSIGVSNVVLAVDSLATGQTATLTVTIIPTGGSVIPLVAGSGSVSVDNTPANNTVQVNVPVFSPVPTLSAGAGKLVGESFLPPNGAIDPGETISVELAVRATGLGATTNLVGSMLLGNGVAATGLPRSYGSVSALNSPVSRVFTLTTTATNPGVISPRVAFVDGPSSFGIFTYSFGASQQRGATNPAAIVIPSLGVAAPYPSTITINNLTGIVGKVTVQLNQFQHGFPDDVDVLLVGPQGQTVMLMSDAGGSSTANQPLTLVFDDAAANSVANAGPLNSGTFKPSDYEAGDTMPANAPAGPYGSTLSVFKGTNPNGTWSLYVVDDSTGDAGEITSGWSLNITTENTLNPPGDLALGASASGNSVVLGQAIQYSFVVTNLGPSNACGVTLAARLSPGASVLTTNISQGSVTFVSNQVTASFGNLITGQVVSAVFSIAPGAVGTFTNSVSVFASQTELTPTNNTNFFTANVSPAAPVMIADGFVLQSESFVPTTGGLEPGETVTLQFALRNVGTAATTNLMATLQASGGVTAPGAPQNFGALLPGGPGASRPFSFTVGAITSSVVTATLALQDGAANLGTVAFNVPLGQTTPFAQTNVIVINAVGAATPYPSTITLAGVTGFVSKATITLNGFTHSQPDDVDILLVGPEGQRFVLLSDAGGTFAVSNLTITIDDAAAAVAPDFTALSSGSIKLTDYEPGDVFPAPAPVGASGSSLSQLFGINPNGTWSLFVTDDSGGDSGAIAQGWQLNLTISKPINPTTDLAVFGSFSPGSVVAGSNLNYTITVTNRGPGPASGVLLSNAIPAGAILVSALPSQGSVQVAGQTLLADFGAIAVSGTATLSFTIVPTSSGAVTNRAGVFAAETDSLVANNFLELVTPVTPPPPPLLVNPRPLGNGQFQFTLLGQNGVAYVIEGSTNLVTWQVISTNTPIGNQLIFTDPAATINPIRMYRARQRDP